MKRLAFVLLALLASSFALFGGPTHGTPTAGRELKVALVLEEGGLPDPFQGIVYAGFRRAVREFGVEGKALTAGPREGSRPTFAYFARQGYDLVLGTGFLQAYDIDAVARRFPATKFALMDGAWEAMPHRPQNVLGTVYKVEEGAYLAGYLAALMERRRPGRDVVSSIGGIKIPTVDSFIAGYQAGARRANPRIAALNGYAQDFSDQARCRRVALSQVARGSGVVFQVAGGCGLGALDVARKKGVWGIGVDADQSFLGRHILTSVLKRLDVATYLTIKALTEGKLRTGRSAVYTLANGGVSLGKTSPEVPRALLARLEHIKRQIISGKLGTIPTTVP
jgi:basic membrane protein A